MYKSIISLVFLNFHLCRTNEKFENVEEKHLGLHEVWREDSDVPNFAPMFLRNHRSVSFRSLCTNNLKISKYFLDRKASAFIFLLSFVGREQMCLRYKCSSKIVFLVERTQLADIPTREIFVEDFNI